MKKLTFIASYVRLITCLLLHRNFSSTSKISSWTSKAMSAENIKNPSTVHNSFAPKKIDGCPVPKLNLRKCFFYS